MKFIKNRIVFLSEKVNCFRDGGRQTDDRRPKLTGRRCVCRACGKFFNTVASFDRHRTGSYALAERRCLSTAELLARGFATNAADFWISSNRPRLTFRNADSSRFERAPLPRVRLDAQPLQSPHALGEPDRRGEP